jgi:plasmid stability protein
MPRKPGRVAISVRVPAEIASALAQAAAEGDRSVSAEVRRVLRRHVHSRRESNPRSVPADTLRARGFAVETCAMDKGYDIERVYAECDDRNVLPIIPLRQSTAVKRGDDKPPTCEHGQWRFAGSDYQRQAAKWRCPTGECTPASRWVKADRLHPLIPRETLRWRKLYRGRAAVEREFGRLKNEWALSPLRVRGPDRVRLHADLTILAKLASALARARVVALAA